MYIRYNANPSSNRVGDCVIRGVSTLLDIPWDEAYIDICMQGLIMRDMPSSDNVWGKFLYNLGYRRKMIPNTCPDCYTVHDFCEENPRGRFLLATGGHVIAVVDGNYFDTWDSGNEVPIYYWSENV